MATIKNPQMDATFTVYWTKYVTIPQNTRKQDREDAIEARLIRTEKYKNPRQDLSEDDRLAYLQ